MPKGFGARTYQQWGQAADLVAFRVTVQETDLLMFAQTDLSAYANESVQRYRAQLETYIHDHPEFQASFEPVAADNSAEPIIREMAWAAQLAGVGPFAAVAGALAEYVGRDLLQFSPEVIVENGGDIFVASSCPRMIGIYAGNSPLTGKIGITLDVKQMPCGICTSSGTVGPSISFGRADAALVIAQSTALADACATALGNRVTKAKDIPSALALMEQIEEVVGAVVILGDKLGAWGQVELVKTAVETR